MRKIFKKNACGACRITKIGQIETIMLASIKARRFFAFSFADPAGWATRKMKNNSCTNPVVLRINVPKVKRTAADAMRRYLDLCVKSVVWNIQKLSITQATTTS